MADLEQLANDLSALTVLEASELAKMLEEKWGVSAAAPVAASDAPTDDEDLSSLKVPDAPAAAAADAAALAATSTLHLLLPTATIAATAITSS